MANSAKTCLPHPKPTTSYWLGQSDGSLANYRSSEGQIPERVDTVIIGSGIIGALTAHNLLHRDHGPKGKSLLMLEARTVASGATGRNGGHIKPDCYKSFNEQKAAFGIEEARKLNSFELANLKEFVRFIKDNNLADEVDLVETRAVDVFLDNSTWAEALSSYESLQATGAHVDHIKAFNSEEVESEFNFRHALGAISFPACSLWPHKLAMAIIKRCLGQGLQLFTHTTVENVASSSTNSDHWLLLTNNGNVECTKVVHATNGYASSLLSELVDKLIPVKGHAVALSPNTIHVSKPLTQTYGIYWNDDYDYLIQRPNDGNPLIYGGGERGDYYLISQALDNFDDSSVNPAVINNLLSMPREHFVSWVGDGNNQNDVRYAWSGILGFTPDGYPYVGEVPGKRGQFVLAGFNGHGMARGFLIVNALCQLMYGEPIHPPLPDVYLDIAARLRRTDRLWNERLLQARQTRKELEHLDA